MYVPFKKSMLPRLMFALMVLMRHAFAIDMQFLMSGDAGRISSPNYPDRYPIGIKCRWLISTEHGSRIRLNFTDFKLEKNKVCLHDYLEFKEDLGEQGMISTKYCGWGTVTTYLSTKNRLELVFVSDTMSIVHRGFSLNWKKFQEDGETFATEIPRRNHSLLAKPITTGIDRPTSATPFIGLTHPKCSYKKSTCRMPCRIKIKGGIAIEVDRVQDCLTTIEDEYSGYRKLVIAFASMLCSIAILSIGMYFFLWRKGFARFDCFPCKHISSLKKRNYPCSPAEHCYNSSTLSVTSDNFVHISMRMDAAPQQLTDQVNAFANHTDTSVSQAVFYPPSMQRPAILSDEGGEHDITDRMGDEFNQSGTATFFSEDSIASELSAEELCKTESV